MSSTTSLARRRQISSRTRFVSESRGWTKPTSSSSVLVQRTIRSQVVEADVRNRQDRFRAIHLAGLDLVDFSEGDMMWGPIEKVGIVSKATETRLKASFSTRTRRDNGAYVASSKAGHVLFVEDDPATRRL